MCECETPSPFPTLSCRPHLLCASAVSINAPSANRRTARVSSMTQRPTTTVGLKSQVVRSKLTTFVFRFPLITAETVT